MKANELRIGNYLFAKGTEVIRFTSFFGLCNIENYPERYTPIPLTEEWLLKFRFKKFTGENSSFDKGKLSVCLTSLLNGEKGRTYFNSWAVLEYYPKYVHQLQNLYFALTGEELIIK